MKSSSLLWFLKNVAVELTQKVLNALNIYLTGFSLDFSDLFVLYLNALSRNINISSGIQSFLYVFLFNPIILRIYRTLFWTDFYKDIPYFLYTSAHIWANKTCSFQFIPHFLAIHKQDLLLYYIIIAFAFLGYRVAFFRI